MLAGAVTLAVGAMMILAPNAAASSLKTITAPYKGYAYGYESAYFSGCGGSVGVSSPPVFNMSNGHGTFAFNVGQVSCGKVENDSDAYADTYVELNPVSLPSGYLTVEVNWKATFSVKLVATPATKSQYAASYFEVYAYSYIYNETNSKYYDQTGSNYVYAEIFSGTLSKTYSNINIHDWLNYTWNSADTYYIYTLFEGYLSVGAGPGSSSATAAFSMDSSSHRAILESVTVS